MSDHAAAYLNQWNSGRAALSSRSNSTAVNTPSPRFDQPRSAAPALHPRPTQSAQNLTARKIEPREAAEASTQALTAPITPLEGPNDVDVVMGGPDVETIEEAESRHSETWSPQNNPWTFGRERRAEEARATAPEPPLHADGRAGKHQRGEKQGDDKKGKEHKGSGDVDVADARMRGTKEEHSGDSDDDASDIQITSWNKLDGNKMTDQHERTNAGAKGPESGRTFKKGVAHVKKPKPKGQKGKTTAT